MARTRMPSPPRQPSKWQATPSLPLGLGLRASRHLTRWHLLQRANTPSWGPAYPTLRRPSPTCAPLLRALTSRPRHLRPEAPQFRPYSPPKPLLRRPTRHGCATRAASFRQTDIVTMAARDLSTLRAFSTGRTAWIAACVSYTRLLRLPCRPRGRRLPRRLRAHRRRQARRRPPSRPRHLHPHLHPARLPRRARRRPRQPRPHHHLVRRRCHRLHFPLRRPLPRPLLHHRPLRPLLHHLHRLRRRRHRRPLLSHPHRFRHRRRRPPHRRHRRRLHPHRRRRCRRPPRPPF
mmetsp:Transcript_3057/g.9222  ORF Transcript_3057/g.9222 Transcript_3057/m.9222 type:complete len:290 (+) Transcript_3057:700-1569(+)